MNKKLAQKVVNEFHTLDYDPQFISSHWKHRNKSKVFSVSELESFRKPFGLSFGLDDRWTGEISSLLLDTLRDVPSKFVFRSCPKENVGNSIDIIKLKNVYMSGNDLVHTHWAYTLYSKIKNNVEHKENFSVLEIGGGYGLLCRILESNMDIYSYSIVELPLSASLAAYYLSMSVDATITLNGKEVNSSNSGRFVNIYTVGDESWMNNKYDLVINTRSMMEMDKKTINYYFDAIQKTCNIGGYFLNINRYHKNSVGDDIEISEFPYDENWTVIESKPSFKQEWIHYLLTQREDEGSDISTELIEIRKLRDHYRKITLLMLWNDRLPSTLQKIIKPVYKFIEKRC